MTTINEIGSVALPAVTITIPARTVTITIPATTVTLPAGSLVATTPIDLDVLARDVAVILSVPVIQPPPPPVIVPPSPEPNSFWVYRQGTFNWGGDYSFAATPDYKDAIGLPGYSDIAVTITGPWGGFLPFAGGTVPLWSFDDSRYNYLVFDFKPTIDGQTAQVYFVKVGDIPVGVVIDPFNGKYGPKPVKGVWGSYKIPLADLGVQGIKVYKFAIQDQTGKFGHTLFLNNIGFTA